MGYAKIKPKTERLWEGYRQLIALIVSGDQDFVPVIKYIRSQLGKRVIIAAFKKTLSYVLERNCNEKIELDDKISEFVYD